MTVTGFYLSDPVFHLIRPEVIRQHGDAIRWNRCRSPACWTSKMARLFAVVEYTLKTFLTERVMAIEPFRVRKSVQTNRTLE